MQSYEHHQRQVSHWNATSTSDDIRNMHDVFSDPFRCAVLYCLQTSEEPVPVSEVANEVLALCPDDAERANVDEPRTWLFDDHIKQLSAFGLVAYDPGRDVVRLSEDVSLSVTTPWQE